MATSQMQLGQYAYSNAGTPRVQLLHHRAATCKGYVRQHTAGSSSTAKAGQSYLQPGREHGHLVIAGTAAFG